jgi:hypothetical protein
MGTDDPTQGPDTHVVESAVAGAVAGLTDDDAPLVKVEETASQRFANYCKGVGGLVSGITAIAAVVFSLIALTRGEPTAKKGYQAVDVVVKQLSTDLQKEYDNRARADELLGKDVTSVREQLQLVVQLLSVRAAPAVRRPVRLPAVTKSNPPSAVSPAPVPASQPAEILKDLTLKSQLKPASLKKAPSARPSLRKLPPLP